MKLETALAAADSCLTESPFIVGCAAQVQDTYVHWYLVMRLYGKGTWMCIAVGMRKGLDEDGFINYMVRNWDRDKRPLSDLRANPTFQQLDFQLYTIKSLVIYNSHLLTKKVTT